MTNRYAFVRFLLFVTRRHQVTIRTWLFVGVFCAGGDRSGARLGPAVDWPTVWVGAGLYAAYGLLTWFHHVSWWLILPFGGYSRCAAWFSCSTRPMPASPAQGHTAFVFPSLWPGCPTFTIATRICCIIATNASPCPARIRIDLRLPDTNARMPSAPCRACRRAMTTSPGAWCWAAVTLLGACGGKWRRGCAPGDWDYHAAVVHPHSGSRDRAPVGRGGSATSCSGSSIAVIRVAGRIADSAAVLSQSTRAEPRSATAR